MQGSIGGQAATGTGQILTGTGSAAGLILSINGGSTGSRGTVAFDNGIAAQMNNLITSFTGSNGLIQDRTDGLNSQITQNASEITAMNARLTQVEANYRKEFTALDTLIGSMQQTQSYLTQELASIPTISSTSA